MQTVDDVYLGQRLVRPRAQLVPGLLETQGVGLGILGTEPRERAKKTARDTDIGRLETDVVIEEGLRTVPLLAFPIGEPADRDQVRALEQTEPVVELEPDAGVELRRDVVEASGGNPSVHGDTG